MHAKEKCSLWPPCLHIVFMTLVRQNSTRPSKSTAELRLKTNKQTDRQNKALTERVAILAEWLLLLKWLSIFIWFCGWLFPLTLGQYFLMIINFQDGIATPLEGMFYNL